MTTPSRFMLLIAFVLLLTNPLSASEISLWYGDTQHFGKLGHPQRWVNVLGHVSDADTIDGLFFTLNGGEERALSFKADKKRIAKNGDFNIEIDRADLKAGQNAIAIIAIYTSGEVVSKKMQLIYHQPKTKWPLPYSINWSSVDNIQDVVQVVDGKWKLTPAGIRSVERYYDRDVTFGDDSWTDYEVSTTVTIHALTPPNWGPNNTGVTHAAIALRWPGHAKDGRQPSVKWFPLGATAEFRMGGKLKQCRWRIFDGKRKFYVESKRRRPLEFETPYNMKHRVETKPDGSTLYRTKLWAIDAEEPEQWDLERTEVGDLKNGSAVLLAHHSDVTFGNVRVVSLVKKPIPEDVTQRKSSEAIRETLASDSSTAITFPKDGGVLNVLDFGATPDDKTDDTAAIQKALDQYPNGNRIIYLPPGEYLVTDTLRWPAGPHAGTRQKRTMLQGAGRDLTMIRVPDGSAQFNSISEDKKPNAKAVIWTGGSPAQRFRNAIRDLTVHTGRNNPSAVGIQFNASNQGTVRNVRIVSGDRQGVCGLDLGHTNEIGPLLVRNVEVVGFDEGIRTWWPVNSCTFEHITLRNQNKYGWHNYHQMIFIRGLKSENSVPAIFNRKNSWGTVTLVDSELRGLPGAEKTAGILNQRQLYVRNTTITGYQKAIDNADKGRDKGDVVEAGLITEDTSHTNVASQFHQVDGTIPAERFHLSVKETPQIPWGDPKTDWANIVSFGADPTGKTDSSQALQQAIDSGAKTVYLPGGGNYLFDSETRIRGSVERIIGLEGRCRFGESSVWKLVDGEGQQQTGDAPAVIIERCNGVSGGRAIPIIHESKRTLIVSSWIGAHVVGKGEGDIFLDDYCGRLDLERPKHHAWCRQLNTEREGTMLTNNGASLWILGMKTEKIGTIIHTKNGGKTDLVGCFIYSNRGWKDGVPAFIIEDSKVRLSGLNERNFNRRPVSTWFHEVQDGVEKTMTERAWVYIGK